MWASMSWTTYFPQKAIRSFFHPSRHKLQSLSFSPFLRESYWKQGLWKTSALEKYSSRPTTKRSRAKTNRVLPRKCTGHSKHPLPTTQEKTLHMDITRRSTPKSDWLYSLQPKMEKLYTVSKNKTGSWLWLRSWPLIAKFRLKLKKVGKTTRPFRYDLNQSLMIIQWKWEIDLRA